MAIKAYAVKWNDGTITIVFAQNKIQAASYFDEFGDPAGEAAYELTEDQLIGLMLEARPVIRNSETREITNNSPTADEIVAVELEQTIDDPEQDVNYEFGLVGDSAYAFENYTTFNLSLENESKRVKIRSADAY